VKKRRKRRKIELKLKKQTQFAAGRNGRKVNYNKGMREICWIGHLVKTNPIQSQSRLAPSTAGSLKGYLKKQTQFQNGQIGVTSVKAMVYGDFMVWRSRKNKAKQSQFAVGRVHNLIGTNGLLRLGDLLEEEALAGIVVGVEGEFVIMIFFGIDDIFGEAESVGPPGPAVRGDRAYEKVACPALYDIVAELDSEVVYRYLDDKLPLLVRILHRPRAGFVNSFAAHLHRHGGSPAGLEFCPADADYRGGDFAVRLEDEFPAAFVRLPCADEKGRELPVAVYGDLDAVFVGRGTPAAGQRGNEKNINQQENESFHKTNFRRPRYMLQ